MTSRSRGFRAGLADRDVRLRADHVVEAAWTAEGGFGATLELLERDRTISAVFAHNDLIALGVLSALHQRGVRVPDDCAVVGCDDMPFAAYVTPSLTTVRIPMRETGRRAMTLLLDRIRGEQVHGSVLLPVELLVRGSTVGSAGESRGQP
ncbi:LacI family DNA-binding transcriptional regulator [Fodinicola feengrottensis]|uniref:LacI family DNA-binding transcriptional regulator n=1 Tax=Fodinicola feengrottensis TaxID=435914 RepID=UPI002441E683|nr:substrate-binding domain-containing protein [Fodinicola feengrottensis]